MYHDEDCKADEESDTCAGPLAEGRVEQDAAPSDRLGLQAQFLQSEDKETVRVVHGAWAD